jgi:hypothetical protein
MIPAIKALKVPAATHNTAPGLSAHPHTGGPAAMHFSIYDNDGHFPSLGSHAAELHSIET